MVTCAPDDVEVYFEGAQGYYRLLVTCAPGDVEVYLLVPKVIIIQVYWLHAHQVTLRFISRVRRISFGFIGYMRTR